MGDVKIRIRGENMFERTARGVRANLKSISNAARAIGRAVKYAAGLFLTLAGASAIAVRAYMKQEDAENTLAAALRSGGDDVEKLIPKYKRFAAAIQKVTTVGDEEIINQMAYGRNLGITAEKLEDATKAAVGLAKRFKIDLNTAMMLVGRASQGQTQMLTRYGIVLDDTMTKEQKFDALLKIGAGSFGLAEAETKTLRGSLDQLSNSFGDLIEHMGKQIEEGGSLRDVFVDLKTAIDSLNESDLSTLTDSIRTMVELLKSATSAIRDVYAFTSKMKMSKVGRFGGPLGMLASFMSSSTKTADEIAAQRATEQAKAREREKEKVRNDAERIVRERLDKEAFVPATPKVTPTATKKITTQALTAGDFFAMMYGQKASGSQLGAKGNPMHVVVDNGTGELR